MKNNLGKIFIGIAILAIGTSIIWSQQVGKKADEGVVISPHTKGNSAASVTLEEYSDFQCPACGQFYPVVKEILDQYGDRIAFEYKHFPLISIHPNAMPAAKAAEAAAQQGKFFEMHDKLFENQSVWSNSANPTPFFLTYATELGLDIELFKRHLKSAMIESSIEDSFSAARDRGLTGTPTFYLNGTQMEFVTLADFRSQIEAALGIVPTATEATSSVPTVEFGI